MSGKKPVLSISLLISNRMDTIPRCLDSLKPIMELLPCELILVDTSNNPEVHTFLYQYTDKVETFEWCNDFSAARNVGLKKATGEWFLFLDDDEWFVDYQPLVDFFKSGEYRQYGCANYIVRSFYDTNYQYFGESLASRMIKLDADTHFESKIHEYLFPVRGKCKNLEARVYHSGYIYATEEDRMKHFRRNVELLEKMLEEEPDSLRWQSQLAQEYRSISDWDALEEYCKKMLDENLSKPIVRSERDDLHVMTLYAGYMLALNQHEKEKELLEISATLLKDIRCMELSVIMMHLNLSEMYYKVGKYDKSILHAWEYLKTREELEKYPDKVTLQNTSLILNETLDKVKINKIYSLLILSDIKRGSTEFLYKYYDRLMWDEPTLYVYDNTEEYIVNALIENLDKDMLHKVLRQGFANSTLRLRMMKVILEWERKDRAKFLETLRIVKTLDFKGWYKPYAALLTLEGNETKEEIAKLGASLLEQVGDIDKVPEDALDVLGKHGIQLLKENKEYGQSDKVTSLDDLYKRTPNIFVLSEASYQEALRAGINPTDYWKEISPELWKNHVNEYLKLAYGNHLERTKQRLEETFDSSNWRYSYFQLALLEKQIEKGPVDPTNVIAYYDLIKTYAEQTIAFYNQYYRDEIFTDAPELLPSNVQAAIKVLTYIELEMQDKVLALTKLKECVELYPKLADAIRKYIQLYPDLDKQRERRQKEELLQLRNQVVSQVQDMLKKGQANEALSIIEQLKQMVPDDLEVVALGLEARLMSLEK